MQAEWEKAKAKGREEQGQKAGGKKRKAQEGKTGAGLGVTQWYPSHREWAQIWTRVPGFLILRPPRSLSEIMLFQEPPPEGILNFPTSSTQYQWKESGELRSSSLGVMHSRGGQHQEPFSLSHFTEGTSKWHEQDEFMSGGSQIKI